MASKLTCRETCEKEIGTSFRDATSAVRDNAQHVVDLCAVLRTTIAATHALRGTKQHEHKPMAASMPVTLQIPQNFPKECGTENTIQSYAKMDLAQFLAHKIELTTCTRKRTEGTRTA